MDIIKKKKNIMLNSVEMTRSKIKYSRYTNSKKKESKKKPT